MLMTEIIRKTEAGYKPASKLDDGPEWFADIRRRALASASGLLSEVVVLSPDRAKALLAANPENRALSPRTVDEYARDIEDGRWAFNGEPIIVSDTGELNDGQHRCAAVVVANRAIEVLLVAGIPRAARTTTDMGKARTPGDFVHMHGITDANKVAAVAAILIAFESGSLPSSSQLGTHATGGALRPTKAAVLTYARSNLPLIKRAIGEVDAKKSAVFASHSRIAGMLAVIVKATGNWSAAADYMRAIVDGEGLSHGDAALAVRDKLLAERQRKALTPGMTFEVILRGWNAHRQNVRVSRMRLLGSIPELVA